MTYIGRPDHDTSHDGQIKSEFSGRDVCSPKEDSFGGLGSQAVLLFFRDGLTQQREIIRDESGDDKQMNNFRFTRYE
jgi:hypothetical protein